LRIHLCNPYRDRYATPVDVPRLGLQLPEIRKDARGTIGLHLRNRVQGAAEPPPLALDLALKRRQLLKCVRQRSAFHIRLRSLFVLFLIPLLAEIRKGLER
jgi:hypothetical protein